MSIKCFKHLYFSKYLKLSDVCRFLYTPDILKHSEYMFRSTGAEGSITMNDHERNLSAFRKLSCYIMQDNQLHANLTVAEAMKVASNLKLGSDVSKEEKEEVVCFCLYITTIRLLINKGLKKNVEVSNNTIHIYLLDSRNLRNTWSI